MVTELREALVTLRASVPCRPANEASRVTLPVLFLLRTIPLPLAEAKLGLLDDHEAPMMRRTVLSL